MTAGELTTLLILQVDATQPQGAGRSAGQAWAEAQDLAQVWANVVPLTARDIETGALAQVAGQYQVTIRWRGDVTEKSRFAWRRSGYAERYLYVVHVPIGPRTEYLTLQCEESQ